MATIDPVTTQVGSSIPPCYAITWTPVSSGSSDVCTAAFVGHLQDVTVQMIGTVTSVAITGSLNGTNFVALTNSGGTTLSAISGAGVATVMEHVAYIKPTVTTGTSVTFIVFGRAQYT